MHAGGEFELESAGQIGQPNFGRIVPRDNVRASIAVCFGRTM